MVILEKGRKQYSLSHLSLEKSTAVHMCMKVCRAYQINRKMKNTGQLCKFAWNFNFACRARSRRTLEQAVVVTVKVAGEHVASSHTHLTMPAPAQCNTQYKCM